MSTIWRYDNKEKINVLSVPKFTKQITTIKMI